MDYNRYVGALHYHHVCERAAIPEEACKTQITMKGWGVYLTPFAIFKPEVNMVEIKLKDRQSGYDAVGEYIRRYWKRHISDTVIVDLATSYDGKKYERRAEIASPYNFDDIEFLYDWWEGEKFIQLFGIQSTAEISIDGGIYEEDT